jgi:hypothetical protein
MPEEEILTIEEAVVHMVHGGDCIYIFNGISYEYFWKDGRFLKRRRLSETARDIETVMMLPTGGCWKKKNKPVKYSKTIWLNVHPEPGCQDEVLVEYLFGKVTGKWIWNRTRTTTCDKEYRITIEEVVSGD